MSAGFRWRVIASLLVCLAVGLPPSLAVAAWMEFLPRPLENGSYFDTFGSYERDNISSSQPSRWTDTFIRERLTLFSNGYSYHPRFLQYQFSLAGTGKQENYDSTLGSSTGWTHGNGSEYDLGLFFLPEHYYNMHVFARRYQPLYKEQSANQHSSIETSYGAALRYRKKPYFAHLNYVSDTVESGNSSSDVSRVGMGGEYFKRLASGNEFSVNSAFNPSWFSGSGGFTGDSNEYLVGSFWNLRSVPDWAPPARLTTTASKGDYSQESPSSGKVTNDQLVAYEILTVDFPWNFRSDVSHRYQTNDSTSTPPGTAPETSLSDTTKDLQLNVVHRLYQSLDTTYSFIDGNRTSPGGESTNTSNSLTSNYTKQIPWGRFMAGINVGRDDTSNTGVVNVINEAHEGIAVPIPGSFILDKPNVDQASILVYLRCAASGSASTPCPAPLVPGQLIPLVEGTNYLVRLIGNSTEIYDLTLPTDPPFNPGTYDFVVSYGVAGTFELQTDIFGSNVSADLFDNLLTPYFSYGTVSSKVVSGEFPGIPADSTIYTTGLVVHTGPVRTRGEYQDLRGNVSPYQSWRASVQYVGAINPVTTVYATADFLDKHYPEGTSTYTPQAFTEKTESVSANVQRRFLSDSMSVGLGGGYSQMEGLTDATAYNVNASLSWRIGKVDVSLTASAYETDTSGTMAGATRRDHELATLIVRRRLF